MVFRTRSDGECFEHLLGEACARSTVEVHAYCLMPNHVHLLLHCPSGGLSDFVQHLISQFTRQLNKRIGSDGAVFRGRFHSLSTDDMEYVSRVGRYIHRNPLDLANAGPIDRYRWSSMRAYTDANCCPRWMHTDVLPALIDGGRDAYREFVAGSNGRKRSLAMSDLEALLDLLVAERLDVGPNEQRSVRRALAFQLAAQGGPATEFLTEDARRSAQRRAVELIAGMPELRGLARIAYDLAA